MLNLYQRYTRKEVHDYFVPDGKFTPNAGTWGLHGCVYIPNTRHDYVFFVTYGQVQGDHIFQEGISEKGVITWQSQPRQHLKENRVLSWIKQKEYGDNIYLFARSKKGDPYTYFGKIEYVSNDPFKEYPVWFEFQLLEWQPSDKIQKEFVRQVTSSLIKPTTAKITTSKKRSSTNREILLSNYDNHVRGLIKSNPHLIDAGDGYMWEDDYELDTGDIADIVFFGPGREVKVVSICTAETEISYIKAIKSKLWRLELCFQREENEASEFIQSYLIAKSVNKPTEDFCKKYNVEMLMI